MEIINISIIDYLMLCRNLAADNGFKWIMVLLARERDSKKSYEDIKQYWDSYNDLTGEQILFIFSLANEERKFYTHYPSLEKKCWVKVRNPDFIILNKNVPTIFDDIFHRERALKNNTNYISDLCNEFNISESKVPAILLFPTYGAYLNEIENPIVIPINNDMLYDTIKKLLTSIENELRGYKDNQNKLKKIISMLNKVDQNISKNKLSKKERHYQQAKKFLSNVNLNQEDHEAINNAIENLDINICDKFSQPIKGNLKQFINLSKYNKNIDLNIIQKEQNISKLEKEKKELELRYKTLEENNIQNINFINRKIFRFKDECEQEKNKNNNITIINDDHSEKTIEDECVCIKI